MNTPLQKTERLHSLDSLRAIMMMLGIVLHASITYIGGDPSFGWPLRDPNTESGFLGWLLELIHTFRMPVFMLIAGFFAALLFYERSPTTMIRNRFSRLVLPFLVFIVLLWPLITLAFSYSNAVFGFNEQFENVVGSMFIHTTVDVFSNISSWIPESTLHLWFIYYLIMFSVVSFSLGMLFKKLPRASAMIKQFVASLLNSPAKKVIVFASANFLLLFLMDDYWVSTSTSFIPDPGTFFFYLYFYGVGWLIFKAKHRLDTFMKHDWLFALSGVALYTLNYNIYDIDPFFQAIVLQAFVNSICVWLFVFGFVGLFMRYCSEPSAKMRYVSDSAYWVYLLHLPVVAFLPGLISDWPLTGMLKFFIVVLGTALVCFATYHYFVRSTAIGQFLNGRKYNRKLPQVPATEAAG